MRFLTFALSALAVIAGPSVRAQEAVTTSSGAVAPAGPAEKSRDNALRVFLDCPSRLCDSAYFRTEVAFVDFVRDRNDAEVHVLITTQQTGSGGTSFTLAFLGRGAFLGTDDALEYVSTPDDSPDSVRKGLVRVFELGLIRYAVHSGAFSHLEIEFAAPEPGSEKKTTDPWNHFIFHLSARGSFDGQTSTTSQDEHLSASANRTTADWKFSVGAFGSYSESRYRFEGPPVTNYVSISRSLYVNAIVIRSLSQHFSAAANVYAETSTFSNEKRLGAASVALEYDVFPYSEATRRLFSIRWWLGESAVEYFDETIYGRTWQYQPNQSIDATLELTQPWGSVTFVAVGSNYFLKSPHGIDVSRNSASGDARLSLRIFKGLAFTLNGSAGLVHDQIGLPKGGATPEEVLLQRKLLETNYTYSASLGLSYTFGSIFSSVVNPRFSSGGSSSVGL